MNLYYGCGAWGDPLVSDKNPQPLDESTPRIRRVHLSHITARDVKVAAGFIYGLAEMPVEDVSLSDVSISLAAEAEAGYPEMAEGLELMQQAGLFVCNAQRLRLHNVEISGQKGPAFTLADSANVDIHACTTNTPDATGSVVNMKNVVDAFVHNCQAYTGTGIFLNVEGDQTSGIVLGDNHLRRAKQEVYIAAGVRPDLVVS